MRIRNLEVVVFMKKRFEWGEEVVNKDYGS